ncbi:PREDICTED: TMV resistance protein N-like isoform X2 [Nelumbo nucifera]|uniref:ADP-ribosyl cyclase/cyclic ADP-ribose hydrolase n=1 Tax=Nelumbo nucifera TaxID=4432 RepID=A0A1U7YXE8_NELNU|nr:PREDICTED: TMV resistance protein N-like isoform X2 [Nelumbo nucifera]
MASSVHRWNYDVFLSFRGEDTRKNFTDHLYTALDRAGIYTFRDDEELKRGKEISSELQTAIEESRISIVVFSRNYASSRWCLDELLKILYCNETMGQLVFPVFYDVEPSEVRNQTGSFGSGFSQTKKRFKADMMKVQSWETALRKAANLSGWDLQKVDNGHEAKCVWRIVEEVLTKLNQVHLDVAVFPVGIDSRVQCVESLLNVRLNGVCIVGIYGMGGIGKTTVAKAVYNLMFRKFDGSSFLENVREVSKQPNGLVCLQNQLISDILMDKEEKQYVKNADRGIIVIQERLRRKRVFIVLDDVDQFDQLKALVGRGWFESGSKIIITTRDEHLLDILQVDSKYKAKELNNDESIQLFSWHAFKKDHPKEDYVELSTNIVSYVKGLPLALEVLGSSLYGKTLPEWRSALEKIKRIPPNQVQRKLRISFDALDDYELKNIFLDIVCFFLGMDKNYVVKILDGCDFAAEYGIGVLCRRSLLTINKNNELRVHDLLRDMGRTIVHEESLEEIGKCSRLWSHEHAYDVLTNYSGTEKIQGISLTVPYGNRLSLTTEAFSKMKELRLLQVNYTNIIGDCKHFSKNLRWLCWHGCPLELIPINFDLKKLAVLDMQDSRIQRLWEETKMLENLKVLDLSYSGFLSELPNFSTFPNLEVLILKQCSSLDKVHESIGCLKKLVLFDLCNCNNLRNLPSSICKLKSLENLNLSFCVQLDIQMRNIESLEKLKVLNLYSSSSVIETPNFSMLTNLENLILGRCNHLVNVHESIRCLKKLVDLSLIRCPKLRYLPNGICELKFLQKLHIDHCQKLENLPEELGNMESLSELNASYSPIKQLPTSIGLLKNLKTLNLAKCKLGSNLSGNFSLIESGIPSEIGSLSSLRELYLSFNKFCSLPNSMSRLCQLEVIELNGCEELKALPELPPCLKFLRASHCKSLERLSNLGFLSSLEVLDLSHGNFCNLPDTISCFSQLTVLNLSGCKRLHSLPQLPSSLEVLYAHNCTSIRLPIFSNIQKLRCLDLSNCDELITIQGMDNFLEKLFKGGKLDIYVPGSEVPMWFSHKSCGSSLSLEVPPDHKLQGLIICVVYEESEHFCVIHFDISTHGNFDNEPSHKWILDRPGIELPSRGDGMWLGYVPYTEFGYQFQGGDSVRVSVRDMVEPVEVPVKMCGIHLVYESNDKGSKSDEKAMSMNTSLSHDQCVDGNGLAPMNAGAKEGHSDDEGLNTMLVAEPAMHPEEREEGGLFNLFTYVLRLCCRL